MDAVAMTPDMASLMAALPHVLAAPKDAAIIRQLCFRPARNARTFPDNLTLTVAAGVPGERWLTEPWLRLPDGQPDPDIQVSILPARVLDLVWRPGDDAPHPGDTMVADLDLSTANLPPGTLLRAGSAILRVSGQFNNGCVKWKARYGADAKDWITLPGHPALRLRGILCAVEQDGVVRQGDLLQKVG
jgi:hypothetical protein